MEDIGVLVRHAIAGQDAKEIGSALYRPQSRELLTKSFIIELARIRDPQFPHTLPSPTERRYIQDQGTRFLAYLGVKKFMSLGISDRVMRLNTSHTELSEQQGPFIDTCIDGMVPWKITADYERRYADFLAIQKIYDARIDMLAKQAGERADSMALTFPLFQTAQEYRDFLYKQHFTLYALEEVEMRMNFEGDPMGRETREFELAMHRTLWNSSILEGQIEKKVKRRHASAITLH